MDGDLHEEVAMTNSRYGSILWNVDQEEIGPGWRKESILIQMSADAFHGGSPFLNLRKAI